MDHLINLGGYIDQERDTNREIESRITRGAVVPTKL